MIIGFFFQVCDLPKRTSKQCEITFFIVMGFGWGCGWGPLSYDFMVLFVFFRCAVSQGTVLSNFVYVSVFLAQKIMQGIIYG